MRAVSFSYLLVLRPLYSLQLSSLNEFARLINSLAVFFFGFSLIDFQSDVYFTHITRMMRRVSSSYVYRSKFLGFFALIRPDRVQLLDS